MSHQPVSGDPGTTCGNCRFGVLIDPTNLGVRECQGLPPTPAVTGGRPGPGGRVELNIELLRPRLSAQQASCSLWKAKAPSLLVS